MPPVLTTLTKVKLHLGIADTSEDTKLDQWILEVESSVLQWLKRAIVSAERTEYYSGSGRKMLVLRHRPVTAVGSVKVDQQGYFGDNSDSFDDSTLWTRGVDWALPRADASEENGGMLMAVGAGGLWPLGDGNIKVVYTAGYTTIPADLELAVNSLVGAVRKMAEAGGAAPIAGETIGRYSYYLLSNPSQAAAAGVVAAVSVLSSYREQAL